MGLSIVGGYPKMIKWMVYNGKFENKMDDLGWYFDGLETFICIMWGYDN